MHPDIPLYVSLLFIVVVAGTIYLLLKAIPPTRWFRILLLLWLLMQAVFGLTGFYTVTDTVPPGLLMMIGPPLLLIVVILISSPGKKFLDAISLRQLTLLHTIRIPVEIVLLLLFLSGTLPKLMTFEGRNLDILSGITAPLMAFWGFRQNKPKKGLLLAWNIVCLGLVINVVIHGILSAPGLLQRISFEQPNVAIQYFPFIWLPSVVVPVVLFCHIAAIRKLLYPSQPALKEVPISL